MNRSVKSENVGRTRADDIRTPYCLPSSLDAKDAIDDDPQYYPRSKKTFPTNQADWPIGLVR